MDVTVKNKFLVELDDIIKTFSDAKSIAERNPDNFYGLSGVDASEIVSRCLSSAGRISGKNSTYFNQINSIVKSQNASYLYVYEVVGIIKALRHDLDNDYIISFEEIVHGDIFADYLEMAEHLISNGYKDAAAVIVGSTLEAHIKQLCNKFGIAIDINGKSKKADTLNAELVKATAYTLLDQKNVTAWLGLRNEAAHGNYIAYSKDQVSLMLDGIRNFIARHPA